MELMQWTPIMTTHQKMTQKTKVAQVPSTHQVLSHVQPSTSEKIKETLAADSNNNNSPKITYSKNLS